MEVRQASLRPDLNGAALCLPEGPRPAIHSLIYPILSLLILLLEVTCASSQHQTHYSRTGDKYSSYSSDGKLHCLAVCCFTS